MESVNERTLVIEWDGEEYRCLPDFAVLMRIEERVLLHQLGSKIVRDPQSIPPTHLQWVIYCLLHSAGAVMRDDKGRARALTAEDVHAAAKDGSLGVEAMSTVASWVIAEVFGVGPKQEGGGASDEGKSEA